MATRQIRTKSGRLRAGERRRRLNEANLQPGEVILLDQAQRRTKGTKTRGAFQVSFVAATQFAADTDVRKLIHRIRLGLAGHYSDQLKAGKSASGRGSLPALKESTLERDPGRPAKFAVKSGELAKRWLLLKIVGGPLQAKTRIKPWGGDGRSFAINTWLGRGIDLQAIDGEAAQVIDSEIKAWLEQAVPESGNGVGTPARVPHKGGELPQFKR